MRHDTKRIDVLLPIPSPQQGYRVYSVPAVLFVACLSFRLLLFRSVAIFSSASLAVFDLSQLYCPKDRYICLRLLSGVEEYMSSRGRRYSRTEYLDNVGVLQVESGWASARVGDSCSQCSLFLYFHLTRLKGCW